MKEQLTFLQPLATNADEEDKHEGDEKEEEDYDDEPGGTRSLKAARGGRTRRGDFPRRADCRNRGAVGCHHSYLVGRR